MSHDDNLRKLEKRFEPARRYANFGSVLESIEVMDFRGLRSVHLDVESPITALSGLNGTGKSTLAQLAACAYRAPTGAGIARNYVVNYFPVSPIDPRPFGPDAKVIFDYASPPPAASQQVTLSRATKEWSGYKRQPERASFYVGITAFLPKVEKRDFSVYGGSRLTVGSSTPVPDEVRSALSTIIGVEYTSADLTEVRLTGRAISLAMVERSGRRYSENHMGFGEGRTFYLVSALETAPEKSLFVIEEPETALHGDAQNRLARYLVEVCLRRGHQIILTTHSAAILAQLSRSSVALLRVQPDGTVSSTVGLNTYQIDTYLHEHRGAVLPAVCVEDDFAQVLLTEALRSSDPDLLTGIRFIAAGDRTSIKRAVNVLKLAGARSVGITDSDMGDMGADDVLSMPGALPPEKEVFGAEHVREYFARSPYGLDLSSRLVGLDHHAYVGAVANALAVPEASIMTEAARSYVEGQPEGFFEDVIAFIRTALKDAR